MTLRDGVVFSDLLNESFIVFRMVKSYENKRRSSLPSSLWSIRIVCCLIMPALSSFFILSITAEVERLISAPIAVAFSLEFSFRQAKIL